MQVESLTLEPTCLEYEVFPQSTTLARIIHSEVSRLQSCNMCEVSALHCHSDSMRALSLRNYARLLQMGAGLWTVTQQFYERRIYLSVKFLTFILRHV
jgi:hypothetical protein